MKNIQNPGYKTLTDALTLASARTKLEINCVKIGVIKTFDPTTQRAEIEIAYKQVKDVLEDGTKVYQNYPPLKECPVIVLFGGVDILSMPIKEGDNCLVFFNDSGIDQWAQNGNGMPPTTARMHDITDAFALVGVRPLTNAIGNYLANGIRLSHGEGNSQIDLKDDLIESIAELFLHNGDMQITKNLHVNENVLVDQDTHIVGETLIEGETVIESKTTIQDDLYVERTTHTDGIVIGSGGAEGDGGPIKIISDIDHDGDYVMSSGHVLSAPQVKVGNGASGTFHIVTVVDGIVVSGSN